MAWEMEGRGVAGVLGHPLVFVEGVRGKEVEVRGKDQIAWQS